MAFEIPNLQTFGGASCEQLAIRTKRQTGGIVFKASKHPKSFTGGEGPQCDEIPVSRRQRPAIWTYCDSEALVFSECAYLFAGREFQDTNGVIATCSRLGNVTAIRAESVACRSIAQRDHWPSGLDFGDAAVGRVVFPIAGNRHSLCRNTLDQPTFGKAPQRQIARKIFWCCWTVRCHHGSVRTKRHEAHPAIRAILPTDTDFLLKFQHMVCTTGGWRSK